MRILIAEDDPISRRILAETLSRWDYEVVVATDGVEALDALQGADAPRLAVLDWMMPGLAGPDVCKRLREIETVSPAYLILLTAKGSKEDIVTGLQSGADDYIMKPFDRHELRARLQVGARLISLQNHLAARVAELQEALSQVKQLQGILPICAHCKRIRGGTDYWQQVEDYIAAHSAAQFSHSICPACFDSALAQARR
ncbi:MAG TPA: response regulator transcription factor [Blastocatellia bacterium]|nr:response regulator transcription factor [Blastocatellia bacterium]